MFESQDINPYWESCLVNSLVLEVTEQLVSTDPSISHGLPVSACIPVITQRLLDVKSIIQKHCESR